jgi:two-component system chemotaxis response regulator CheB
MTFRVLVVDDSAFFRRRIVEMLNSDPNLEVVETAANGREAVDKARSAKPDVITMDIEMPEMDGISAVRRIMAANPTPVLMFSSLTHEGAKATLDALEAGAMDFLPKSFDDISKNRDEVARVLCRRVTSIARRARSMARPATPAARVPGAATAPAASADTGGPVNLREFGIVAIGASTGGPVALQKVLQALPGNYPLPLVLIQHMPATFTPAFAERLNQQCAISVKEAADGDELKPGLALLAPGGKQMTIETVAGRTKVRISESEPTQHYRPCVDVTFNSVASAFGSKALAVVLTGMGADGREGARLLKQKGSKVWAQDEATSVIWGMPGAVAEAGLADRVLPLLAIGPKLAGKG